jgi:endogenous inhibitor of DNA gyrase (YacG/DUF329 family)
MTTTTGRCAACGQPFTTNPSQRPRRRYCCDRCRKRDWGRRHATHRRHLTDVVPHPGDVTGDVVAPPAISAPRCPHCARPIAVINLLVAPAAALVARPQTSHD